MKYSITDKFGRTYETESPIWAYAIFFAEANELPKKDYEDFANYAERVTDEWDCGPVPYGNLFDHIAYKWKKVKKSIISEKDMVYDYCENNDSCDY